MQSAKSCPLRLGLVQPDRANRARFGDECHICRSDVTNFLDHVAHFPNTATMATKLSPFVTLAVACAMPHVAHAQGNPEAKLRMCVRDGKNLLERTKRHTAEMQAALTRGTKPGDCASDTPAEQREANQFHARCVADATLRSLPGYQDVVAFHAAVLAEEQRACGARTSHNSARDAKALAQGPGGDQQQRWARWDARPERCRVNPTANPPHDQSPAQALDALTRSLLCGYNVAGILQGASHHPPNGTASDLAGAVLTTQDSDARVMYRTLLAYACYGEDTEWKSHDYPAWALCALTVGETPTPEGAAGALAKLHPSWEFERQNIAHMATLAAKSRPLTDTQYVAMGNRYPALRTLFWEGRVKALANYQAQRANYAAIVRILDPISATLDATLSQPLPADCARTLTPLRKQLKQPGGPEGAIHIGAELGVGYQLTEALMRCAYSRKAYAQAARDAALLGESARKVTAEEAVYVDVELAVAAATHGKSSAFLQAQMPGANDQHLPLKPESMRALHPGPIRDMLDGFGPFEKIGKAVDEPAIVERVRVTADTATITFRKVSWKVPDHEVRCTQSKRIRKWRIGANELVPVYDENCKIIKERWRTVSYQAPTVTVPAADAALVKPGLWAEIWRNRSNPADATVVHAHEANGRERTTQRVIFGVPVT